MMGTRRPASPVILVHGGCGASRPTTRHLATIRQALDAGYAVMDAGGSSVDAVEHAVALLETSGRFNAGKGAKRQMDGVARMDASLMDGRDLAAGAVAAIEGILTPIRVARCVMERTPHVLLVGESAGHLARIHHLAGLPAAGAPGRRPIAARVWRNAYRRVVETGTVGAVARDNDGHVAAATSTGGIHRMLPGRVGDSPLIGAGTYADDGSGAVSLTGTGETIIRMGLAKEIASSLERGLSPRAAGTRALLRMRRRIGGEAGAIVLSSSGGYALLHTTPYMASGYRVGQTARVSSRFQRVREA